MAPVTVGQADRRRVPRVRKPGRSSEDVVLLNGYQIYNHPARRAG